MRGQPVRRIAALLVAGACALGTASCTSAHGATEARSTAPVPGTYLALGDSVPFGYRGGAGGEYRDAAHFTGYPGLVGRDLGLRVVDATCPGETTASFLDPTAQSNGCENSPTSPFGYRTAYPLHTFYDSVDQSQLDFAVRTLARTRDVRLVTLQIGANDAFLCQETTADHCAAAAERQALVQTVRGNVERILGALRERGGYGGRIVVVTYYALDYTGAAAAATQGLDAAIARAARANGAAVASGYDAFRPRAVAAGGSSITAGLVLPNDVHPSAAGQELLARAVEAAVPR